MDVLIRLLMRILLVPLGLAACVLTATLVAAVANWARFTAIIAKDPAAQPDVIVTSLLLVAALAYIHSAAVLAAAVGTLIAEAFAIRSWIFHALNGGVSIWISWTTMEQFRKPYEFYDDPKVAIAAGLAGGLAYWAVAGWSAGFWKPVFRGTPASAGAEIPR